MKVTDLIKSQKEPFYSLEITPPLKIKSIEQIFHVIDRIKRYNPRFINITYHQQAVSMEEIDGIPTKVIYQKHASTVGVCS
ncbi:MAG TPA: methylenetetrahydrofolate reductase, partial [Candidatus Cloacimonadota bacterium]|nr:methylenetetrahydrofolate reductase [Candidatus Cloacimonadota bacterium]